jgi:hypothetical protein
MCTKNTRPVATPAAPGWCRTAGRHRRTHIQYTAEQGMPQHGTCYAPRTQTHSTPGLRREGHQKAYPHACTRWTVARPAHDTHTLSRAAPQHSASSARGITRGQRFDGALGCCEVGALADTAGLHAGGCCTGLGSARTLNHSTRTALGTQGNHCMQHQHKRTRTQTHRSVPPACKGCRASAWQCMHVQRIKACVRAQTAPATSVQGPGTLHRAPHLPHPTPPPPPPPRAPPPKYAHATHAQSECGACRAGTQTHHHPLSSGKQHSPHMHGAHTLNHTPNVYRVGLDTVHRTTHTPQLPPI